MILDYILNESSTTGYDIEPTNNGYDASGAGALQIVSESMAEMHQLNTAVAVADYKSIQLFAESGMEAAMALQEGVIGDFFAKVRQIIEKMWKKIKEFFSNVALYFSKGMKNDKFLEKYKDELNKADTSGFEFEGYDYGKTLNLNVDKGALEHSKIKEYVSKDPKSCVKDALGGGDAKAKTEKIIDVLKDKDTMKTEVLDAVRGKICNGAGNVSADEFKTKAMEILRGGDSKKELSISTDSLVNAIKSQEKEINVINGLRKDAEASFKSAYEYVKECEKAFNEAVSEEKDQDKKNLLNKYADVLKFIATLRQATLNLITTAAGYAVDARKEYVAQSRECARKLLIHNRKEGKKENVNASFGADEGVLSNIMKGLGY